MGNLVAPPQKNLSFTLDAFQTRPWLCSMGEQRATRDDAEDAAGEEGGSLKQEPGASPLPNTAPTKKPFRVIRRRPPTDNAVTLDRDLVDRMVQASGLPTAAYSFEIYKTVLRMIQCNATHVALQMPEGLLMYATVLADLFQRILQVQNGKNSNQKSDDKEREQQQPLLRVSVLGDVTYGACCINDIEAKAVGAQLLIHYGHSCLIPLQHTTVIPCLYVFVEILFDTTHFIDCVDVTMRQKYHGASGHEQPNDNAAAAVRRSSSVPEGGEFRIPPPPSAEVSNQDAVNALVATVPPNEEVPSAAPTMNFPHVYLLATVQFRHALAEVQERLQVQWGYRNIEASGQKKSEMRTRGISIPQAKPLSPGEVLGCTSPKLDTHLQPNYSHPVGDSLTALRSAVVCFVADGRFHLESTMISNPHIETFYRYDPYSKTLSIEEYDHEAMHAIRRAAIGQVTVPKGVVSASTGATATTRKTFGIIMGTLGRQGNPAIVQRIQKLLRAHGHRHFLVLLSEITPARLAQLNERQNVNVWVQVACPRLSVDWGHYLSSQQPAQGASNSVAPILTPYELFVALEETSWRTDYPMDYYSYAGGPWSNYFETNKERQLKAS
jgi:2-(3-amino-3-carboxypropyl)histidine synthase